MLSRTTAHSKDGCYACLHRTAAPIPGSHNSGAGKTATHRSGNTRMKIAPLVIALAAAAGAIALMAASSTHATAPVQATSAR